ncbi:MAG TPA: disulfide bond formation protein B [Candidatus Paceibacterota bacterium]
MVELFSTIIAVGILLLGAFTLLALVLLLLKHPLISRISAYSNTLLRIVFVGAALGSMTYELAVGYTPCLLCWYQRMAIFPIAILLFTADIRTSLLLRKQVLILGVLGLIVALVHNYIDMVPNGLDICGAGPSCLLRYVNVFGFVTIPFMSAIVLISGIVFAVISKRYPHPSRI